MKIIFGLLLIFICTTVGFSQIKRGSEPKFNPTGFFSPASEVPNLFPYNPLKGSRIEIEIRTASFEVNKNRTITPYFAIPPEGVVKDSDVFAVVGVHKNEDYKFTKIEISGFQIVFTTETIEGISYTFSGQFLKGGKYYKSMPKGIVLKGKLTRVRNGKKEAEGDASFSWYGGD